MTKNDIDRAITIEQQDWMRFLTADGLAEKAGCAPNDFDKMVVKEFADNAADIGGFGYSIDEAQKQCSIWDSGSGISKEEVVKLFDIKRPLRSSKHWRRGQRGALGNGIRAALAGCRIYGIELIVASQGQQHRIQLQANGEVVTTTEDAPEADSGTRIVLGFPTDRHFNPSRYIPYLVVARKTQGLTVTTGKPLASWFKAEDINVIVQSLSGMQLGEFVGQFNITGDLSAEDLTVDVKDLPTDVLVNLLRTKEGSTEVVPLIRTGLRLS